MLLTKTEDHVGPNVTGEFGTRPCAVGDPVHVEKSFARNPGGLVHVRSVLSDRSLKAQAVRRI